MRSKPVFWLVHYYYFLLKHIYYQFLIMAYKSITPKHASQLRPRKEVWQHLWLTIKYLFVSNLHILSKQNSSIRRPFWRGYSDLTGLLSVLRIQNQTGNQNEYFNISELHPIVQPGHTLHSRPKFHQETQENQHMRTVNVDDKWEAKKKVVTQRYVIRSCYSVTGGWLAGDKTRDTCSNWFWNSQWTTQTEDFRYFSLVRDHCSKNNRGRGAFYTIVQNPEVATPVTASFWALLHERSKRGGRWW